ncbi:MAG: ankyrin repeat domain-containing protein [Terracidiphilus sp.]
MAERVATGGPGERWIHIRLLGRKRPLISLFMFVAMLATTAAFAKDKKLPPPDTSSPLISASVSGNIEVVRDLIENGADVNGRDARGNFPLYAAVVGDHADVVELLIKKGANVNQTKAMDVLPVMERNSTALDAASVVGDETVVELLVNAGADVNAFANINEETARSAQSLIGDGQPSKFLTPEFLATLRALLVERDITPLTQASKFDHAKVVTFLLEHGADLNFQRPGNNTALIEAAGAGSRDVVELLISRKAELNRKGFNGGTALAHALYNEQFETAKILMAAGADFQLDDSSAAPWRKHFAWGAYQSLVAEKLKADGKNAESKSKFTDAIASLTAARDGADAAYQHASEEASKAEKDAKSAGRLANVFAVTNAVTDVAVPVLTDFSRSISQRQMEQVAALRSAKTPDQYFANFERLEQGIQPGSAPSTTVAEPSGNGPTDPNGSVQIMRASAESMRQSAQGMRDAAQIFSEKAAACNSLLQHIATEMASFPSAPETH